MSAVRRVKGADRGVQYLSLRYTERLVQMGIAPSVGSVGDSYDNALAESIIGLYKTELIARRGPWRYCEAVELATPRASASSTVRGTLLPPTARVGDGCLTQANHPPGFPGRFTDASRPAGETAVVPHGTWPPELWKPFADYNPLA